MANGGEQISFKRYATYPSPSGEGKKTFFERINNSGSKPAILSILPGFAKKYEPSVISNKFPTSMSDLLDVKNVEFSLEELQERCKTIIFTMTKNQVENVEKSKRLQVKSSKWNYFRSGRITASKFRSACCTDTVSPSKSLIKNICYPVKIQTEATEWGL